MTRFQSFDAWLARGSRERAGAKLFGNAVRKFVRRAGTTQTALGALGPVFPHTATRIQFQHAVDLFVFLYHLA